MTGKLATLAPTPTTAPTTTAEGTGAATHRLDRSAGPGDAIFAGMARGASLTITGLIAAIGIFLMWRAVPALGNNEGGLLGFLTYRGDWNTSNPAAMTFGIPNLLAVTVTIAAVALALAMPVALGISLYLTHYAPARIKSTLSWLVDILAAVPSIVYGLWGAMVLGPALGPIFEAIHRVAGGIPLFAVYANSPAFATSRNIFTGGIVLAIMILPIIAATAREVFAHTPRGHIESALALGATRWEVIRLTVIPFGRTGFIAGAMLGLGRALGETMALYLVVSPSSAFRGSLFDGGTTFATAIANAAPEFNNNITAGAYIAAGLVLFIVTFAVNAAARAIVARSGAKH